MKLEVPIMLFPTFLFFFMLAKVVHCPGDFPLEIRPQFVEISHVVEIQFRDNISPDIKPISCNVSSDKMSRYVIMESQSPSVEWEFNTTGEFKVHMTCKDNKDTKRSRNLTISVYETFTGFEMTSEPMMEPILIELSNGTIDRVVNFTFTTGTFLKILPADKLQDNGKVVIDEIQKKGLITFHPSQFSKFGLQSMSYHVYNQAGILNGSKLPVVVNFEINYQEKVETVRSNFTNMILLFSPTIFSVSSGSGSDVVYEIESPGPKLWVICFQGGPSRADIAIIPNTTSPFTISVTISNVLGNSTVERTINVVKPVEGFELYVDGKGTSSLFLKAPTEDYFQMGTLSVEAYDSNTILLEKSIVDIKAGQSFLLLAHITPGHRNISVQITSEVSKQLVSTEVSIENKITATLGDNMFGMIDTIVEIVLLNSSGFGFQYSLDFGDKNVSNSNLDNTFRDGDLRVTYMYHTAGNYTVTLFAYNSDTKKHSTMYITIMDLKVISESIALFPKGLLDLNITVKPFVPRMQCHITVDNSSYVEVQDGESRQITFNTTRVYRIGLACSHLPDTFSQTKLIEVKSFELSDLEFTYSHSVSKGEEDVEVEFRVTLFGVQHNLPDIGLSWNFYDGSAVETSSLSNWRHVHLFKTRGQYNIIVTASMDGKSSHLFTLPIQIGVCNFDVNATSGWRNVDSFDFVVSNIPADIVNMFFDFGDQTNDSLVKQNETGSSMVSKLHVYEIQGSFLPKVTLISEDWMEVIYLSHRVVITDETPALHLTIDELIQMPPGLGTLTFKLNWNLDKLDTKNCYIKYSDGREQEILLLDFNNSSQVSFTREFTDLGVHTITAKCRGENKVPYEDIQVSTLVVNYCYQNQSSVFNVDNPTRKKVSAQFIVSADPKISCNSLTPVFHWNVDIVQNNTILPYSIEQSNTTLLILPARSMEVGTFIVTFYTHFKETPSLFKTDSFVVIYESSPLVATIKGGSMKTVGVNQEITVDGLTLSYDPDDVSDTAIPLTYSWTISTHSSLTLASQSLTNSPGKCEECEKIPTTKGVFVWTPDCLAPNQWYVFRLQVSKGSRRSITSMILYVAPGAVPLVDVKCKVNCLVKVNAEFSFNLESECLSCTRAEQQLLTYEWRLFIVFHKATINEVTRFSDITETGTRIATMAIKPYSLVPGKAYLLMLTYKLPTSQPVTLRQDVTVNYTPYNGSCALNPVEGYAVYDRFQVICENWLDEGDRQVRSDLDNDDHLLYRFILQSGSRSSLLYAGGSRMTTEQVFNMGEPSDNYNVMVTVRVYDRYNGMVELNITGRVLPPLQRQDAMNRSLPLDEILNDFDAEIRAAQSSGNIHDVLRTVESAGSALNGLDGANSSAQAVMSSDDWLSAPDVSDNGTLMTWMDMWKKDELSGENAFQNRITQANNNYLLDVSASVNSSNIASIDTVYMASTSVTTLLSNLETVNTEGLQAAADTVESLGESLEDLVTVDMSDIQVNEVLESVQEAADRAMENMIPSYITSTEPVSFDQSITDIEQSRKYEKGKENRKLEVADMHDEERAFLRTRSKLKEAYYDKQKIVMAEQNVPRLQRTIDIALESAAVFMVDGQNTKTLKSENVLASVERKPISDILQADIDRGNVTLKFVMKPGEVTDEDNLSQSVSMKTVVYSKNPLTWDKDGTGRRITSPAVFVNISEPEYPDAPINNTRLTVSVLLPNGDHTRETQTIKPQYIALDSDQMLYHRMQIASTKDTILVSVKPSAPNLNYDVFFRSGEFPTSTEFDFQTSVQFKGNEMQTVVCPPESLHKNGTVFIALKPKIMKANIKSGTRNVSTATQPLSEKNAEYKEAKEAAYEFGVSAVGCPLWFGSDPYWDIDPCQLDNITDLSATTCICDLPFSSIFTLASTFYLPVNTVDFSTVFKEIDLKSNSSVFAVVFILLCIYAVLMVWARRKDMTDIIKWGVTSLADNSPNDKHFYIVTTYTGMRMAAGTKSKVGFVIAGEKDDTGVRSLNDGIRKGFPNQSVLHFLMAVPACLGDLQYVRIWHDNSGKGSLASWFLHKIVVEDLQCDKTYIFKCDTWLGVDESDGLIERLLPVSSKETLINFSSLFYNNARENVTDSHIWFSVLFRPQRSHFTRVQRLSCCVCLLFLSMICNALFYQGRDNVVRPTIKLGFLRLSVNQVYTSVISIFIVTPVELGLIWLFKKSRPREDRYNELPKITTGCRACFLPRERLEVVNALLTRNYAKPKGILLPHFCVYIAWIMVALCISSSGFFVFLLSQQWGRAKSEEWLTSFLLTFVESLTVLDPLKVIMLAVFVSLFVHKLQDESNGLNKDELKTKMATGNTSGLHGGTTPSQVVPLEEEVVRKVRKVRLQETKTFEVVKETLLYLLFLFTMVSISYTNRDPRSFMLKKNIFDLLVNQQQGGRLGFSDVNTMDEYFDWLNRTVFPVLFHEKYFNMTRRHWRDRYFIQDLQNARVGPLRLRQVRAFKGGVNSNSSMSLGDSTWQFINRKEEKKDYCLGWNPPPCAEEERVFKLTSNAWTYTETSLIWGMPVIGVYSSYSGGGYIPQLNINLDVSSKVLEELFAKRWVDEKTRLLTLDFTLYNANSNLFCFVSLVAEFPGTGGAITTMSVFPFRVYQYSGALGVFAFWTEMCFIFLLIIALIKFGLKLIKRGLKYLYDLWHVVDLITIICCISVIALYGLRKLATEMALHKYKEDPRRFINFQQVTVLDYMLVTMIGLVNFTCTIRTVKILGFSKRLSTMLAVISSAKRDLFYFSLMVLVFLMAFVGCGYFMFSQNLTSYKTVIETCETLVTSLVGKSPFKEIRHNEPIQAQIYFSVFVFFFVFVLLTMFQVILNQSIARVRYQKDIISEQYEIVQNVLRAKIKQFFSIFGASKEKDEREFNIYATQRQPTTSNNGKIFKWNPILKGTNW